MPLKINEKHVQSVFNPPREKVEFWGIKIPIITAFEDFPLGTRTAVRDLIRTYDGVNMGKMVLQLFCYASELNVNPEEQITFDWLSRQRLTPEGEQELIEASTKVTGPFLQNVAENYRTILEGIENAYAALEGLNQAQEEAEGDTKNATTPTGN